MFIILLYLITRSTIYLSNYLFGRMHEIDDQDNQPNSNDESSEVSIAVSWSFTQIFYFSVWKVYMKSYIFEKSNLCINIKTNIIVASFVLSIIWSMCIFFFFFLFSEKRPSKSLSHDYDNDKLWEIPDNLKLNKICLIRDMKQ